MANVACKSGGVWGRRIAWKGDVAHQLSAISSGIARFESTYSDAKKAAKKKRTDQFNQRLQRLERLKTRRESVPSGVKRNEFRAWFNKRLIYQETVDRKARQVGLDWNIRVAAVVERLPVVTPDKPDWEKDYLDLKAYLSQFGKEYPSELVKTDSSILDSVSVPTDEELLELLPEGFVPAPRETEADKTGDVRTLDRSLKTRAFLAVLGKNKNPKWGFPTVALKEGETLLDAAQRAVVEAVGSEIELYCPSNCPVAVDMNVPHEDKRKDGMFGTKTFFMRVQHDEGDVVEDTMNVADFAWLERSEMVERALKERGEGPSKFYHYLL